MSQLPPDIQRVLTEIDDADHAAEGLVANLSETQFHWQPDAGRAWSVGQCLEHLSVINFLYGGLMRQAVDEARRRGLARGGPLAPGPFGRWFIRSQEPPVTRRFRTPGKIRPASGLARAEIVSRFREAHDLLRGIARDAATIDANRATYANPFLKMIRMKVATGLLVLPAHDRRHLWQAERVTKHPEFPSG